MSTPAQRLAMAKEIVNLEARRDKDGHLDIYRLPANDGGGAYEVAGINEKYNPAEAARLRDMIQTGQYVAAENYAQEVIAKDTDSAAKLTKIPGIESYLRDCVFNRGATGAIMICQYAVEASVDGEVGPDTRAKIAEAEKDPEEFLKGLRIAREWYERNKTKSGYRANMWAGLVNRWNNAMTVARKFPMSDDRKSVVPNGQSWLTLLGDLFLRFTAWLASQNKKASPVYRKTPIWMPWVIAEIGFHEVGVNLGIEKYIDLSKNGTRAQLLGEPWCADFSNAGFEAVGIRGTRSAMARSYEKSEYFVEIGRMKDGKLVFGGPAYGCIVTMWRGSPSSGSGHVFFYLGENEHGIYGVGGNQSDSVSREYHPRNRIVGYYWPKAVPLPVTGAVTIAYGGETKGSET